MTILRKTDKFSRTQLVVTRHGLSMQYLRPKVGGGWYVRNSVTLPWTKR